MKSTGELEGEAIEITLKLLGDVKDFYEYCNIKPCPDS